MHVKQLQLPRAIIIAHLFESVHWQYQQKQDSTSSFINHIQVGALTTQSKGKGGAKMRVYDMGGIRA